VAEGSSSSTQIQITNNDDAYLAPIRAMLDAWKVGHHTVSVDREIAETGIKGHTQSLVIHSTLLTTVMRAAFGHISYEKTLPDWVFQAPDEFVAGLMDGYICGDGCITMAKTITASSVSEALIIRLGTLLSQYGIFSTVSSRMPPLRRFKSVSRHFTLSIPVSYAFRFAMLFKLSMAYKQERLDAMVGALRECKWREFNETVLDRVVTIKEVEPKGGRVYDLTVEGTRNFTALNCLALADTFHLAGVAAKSGMTRGVPRLKELLTVTQNPKATSLTIFLRPDIRKNKEEARRLAQELEFTTLKDLVSVSRIYYDPRDSASLIADDQEWLSFFAAFEADEEATDDEKKPSPWILRFELDRERMFNKNITMEDISFVLREVQSDLSIIYTDHNASRMIFRIRVNHFGDDAKYSLDDLNLLKQLQNKLLTQTLIRGLPGLRSVSFRKMTNEIYEKNPDSDGKYEPVEQFVIDTFGTNFMDVMIHPDVDGTKLISNHIHDIYENLGIEAARQILFREIFTLFEQAAPVNYRHVAILCDALTNRGRLMSANRIGVNKKAKIGPLAKASFEQTQDIVLRAALFGEVDPVTGVSANIMTGQPIRGGTSFSHILLDEAALKELIASAPPPKRTIERAPALTQMQVDAMLEAPEQAGCRQQDLRIPAALPPMDPTSMVPDELPELEISLVDE
jgi:DNA-directed RNA polymerase beta' subunit